jgi:hypothetical protein
MCPSTLVVVCVLGAEVAAAGVLSAGGRGAFDGVVVINKGKVWGGVTGRQPIGEGRGGKHGARRGAEVGVVWRLHPWWRRREEGWWLEGLSTAWWCGVRVVERGGGREGPWWWRGKPVVAVHIGSAAIPTASSKRRQGNGRIGRSTGKVMFNLILKIPLELLQPMRHDLDHLQVVWGGLARAKDRLANAGRTREFLGDPHRVAVEAFGKVGSEGCA